MLRELTINEMAMVSGGNGGSGDEIVTTATRISQADATVPGPNYTSFSPGSGNGAYLFNGQTYATEDEWLAAMRDAIDDSLEAQRDVEAEERLSGEVGRRLSCFRGSEGVVMCTVIASECVHDPYLNNGEQCV